MSKSTKKIQHEYNRNFKDSVDKTTVVFSKNPQVNSQAYKEHQKQVSQRGANAPDEDGGIMVRPEASLSFCKELQQARLAKGNMKQSELAKILNMKASVINEWESGKVVPNGQQKSQLGKILGVRFSKHPKVHPTKSVSNP